MTLTRRQALALAATAPVAAVLPATIEPRIVFVGPGCRAIPTWAELVEADRAFWAAIPTWAELVEADRAFWAAIHRQWSIDAKRPPVQLSTLSTPQENRDRNHIDEACGTKSVQIDPTGDKCPDVSV